MNENDQKDARIKELETLVAALQTQLRTARATIEQFRGQARRNYRDDHDYLEYEEDRR